MKTREKVKRHFLRHTTLRPVFHDYTDDQKRLQDEFDKQTLLRWNLLTKTLQVWYDAPRSGLYCVHSFEMPCSITRIIYTLKRRQQDARAQQAMYEAKKAEWNKESEEKIADTANHTADALQSWSVGKVTTSGKGLTI